MKKQTKAEFAALFDRAPRPPVKPWSQTPKRVKATTRKEQQRAAVQNRNKPRG